MKKYANTLVFLSIGAVFGFLTGDTPAPHGIIFELFPLVLVFISGFYEFSKISVPALAVIKGAYISNSVCNAQELLFTSFCADFLSVSAFFLMCISAKNKQKDGFYWISFFICLTLSAASVYIRNF